mmetsp:Transcript_32080/g.46864  ORF Transcript_32080/g.46864 Transcript_32080/m.46864 type:complete len:101 (-) Transcript_32080:90-392(-)
MRYLPEVIWGRLGRGALNSQAEVETVVVEKVDADVATVEQVVAAVVYGVVAEQGDEAVVKRAPGAPPSGRSSSSTCSSFSSTYGWLRLRLRWRGSRSVSA